MKKLTIDFLARAIGKTHGPFIDKVISSFTSDVTLKIDMKGRSTRGRKKVQFRKRDPNERSDIVRDIVPERLPQLQDQLSTGFTLRFITQSAFAGVASVTFQNLLDAWFIAGTATTAYQLFDFVKIRRVTVRASIQPVTGGFQGFCANVGIEFPGLNSGQTGSGKQRQNSSLSPNVPACVSLTPGKDTLAGKYQQSVGSAAFFVRATDVTDTRIIGAIIDVEVSYKNSGDVNPAALAVARAGLVPGSIYFGGMDGQTPGATVARTALLPAA